MKKAIQNFVQKITITRMAFFYLAMIISSIHVAAALSGEYKVFLIFYPLLFLVLVINANRSGK